MKGIVVQRAIVSIWVMLLCLTTVSASVAQGIKLPQNISPPRETRAGQDVTGARDHPLLKRYPGSSVVRYEKQKSGSYTLPTGPVVKWDYTKELPDFAAKKLDLEVR